VDLTRVGGRIRVSDVNADQRSPHDAGRHTKLPARVQREAVRLVRSSPNRSIAQIAMDLGVSENSLVTGLSRQRSIRESAKD
jgi:hypothetical protein